MTGFFCALQARCYAFWFWVLKKILVKPTKYSHFNFSDCSPRRVSCKGLCEGSLRLC